MRFEHHPHPHVASRRPPGKATDELSRSNWYTRLNARVAIVITVFVGSMSCAWLFAIIALLGLPRALSPGNIGPLYWFAGDFLQLTLLSVILVGQNIQSKAADKRASDTYKDAEAVLHEALEIQRHLASQDTVISHIEAKVNDGD